ncbi:MAG: hypothetical protein RR581_06375 [Eubacterium sp.]
MVVGGEKKCIAIAWFCLLFYALWYNIYRDKTVKKEAYGSDKAREIIEAETGK